ncbi:MAG: DivIVA domain-containing protein [Thermoanaerobaculia bacterium]|nr:DivIVA domain-containing protein [Thermoanaerobaculia bacterium]
MSDDHESRPESGGLTPLAIRKIRFDRKLRGYDPEAVEEFRDLVAEELGDALTAIDELRREKRRLESGLADAREREEELQETLLRAQKVSDEIMATSHREAQLLVKEAEMTADKIVQQAIDRAQEVESRIEELRARRHELHVKLKGTVELYARMLEEEGVDDPSPRATIHRMPRGDEEAKGS